MSNPDGDEAVEGSLISLKHKNGRANGAADILQQPTTRKLRKVYTARRARDITSEFRDATNQLQTGELIKDEYFTLFEAVGALEIMDSKMDSGFLKPGETLDDDYDVLRQLEPEDVLGIIDGLLSSEVAWHKGHPLSQTVFTSLYIDKLLWPEPKRCDDANFSRDQHVDAQGNPYLHIVLRAYCMGLIKTCHFVHSRINIETYYEEEDFVANLYHRTLLSSIPIDEIIGLLEEAIGFLQDALAEENEGLLRALIVRLRWRRIFLEAVAAKLTIEEDCRVPNWTTCLEQLPEISQTAKLGRRVPEAWSVKIQRRLASSVPPRPIVSVDVSKALEFFEHLCADGIEAEKVLQCPKPSNIMTFVLLFQARKPQPPVFMRCYIQSLIFAKTRLPDKEAAQALLFEDLAELVLPASPLLYPSNATVEAPHDDRFQIAQKMLAFAHDACEPYYDLLRTLNMNRCRIRRMLCHTVLDWDTLQLDFEALDAELRRHTRERALPDDAAADGGGEAQYAYPLSSWACDLKLRQMTWIVQLGAELGIYQAGELAGVYFYLMYLAETRLHHVRRISRFVIAAGGPASAALRHCVEVLQFNYTEASATMYLAKALYELFQALTHLELLPAIPLNAYSSDELRHHLRLRPFLSLSHPPVPPPEAFPSARPPAEDPASSKHAILEKLDLVDAAARGARGTWDKVMKSEPAAAQCVGCEDAWRASIKEVLKSAIAVGVAAAGLRKWVKEGGKGGGREIKVEVGEGMYHAWWIVPKIIVGR